MHNLIWGVLPMLNVRAVATAVILFSLTISFQNCSDVGFSTGKGNKDVKGAAGESFGTINQPGAFPGMNGVNGISGGHFDLDTSTKIYAASAGTTNHHEHEYDKKHKTTIIDFFNLIDPGYDNIQSAIPTGRRFVLNVVNASLSPGGVLDINGSLVGVTGFKRGQVFTIGPASVAGDVSLNQFRLGFSPDVLANNGLVPTATSCVRANDPGKLGEYRNGALTIQALDADNFTLDPATGAASSGLLWEANVFWHWNGGCYK